MLLRVNYKKKEKNIKQIIIFCFLNQWRKKSDPEVDPDPLDRGTDPRIRIRT